MLIMLKLDLNDKTTYKYTQDKNPVRHQHTLFDSSRFSHSDCGSSPVKQANNIGRKQLGSQRSRTSECITTELGKLICRVGYKLFLHSAIYSYNAIRCCVMHA